MNIVEVTPQRFDGLFAPHNPFFGTAAFAGRHAVRCDAVRLFIFEDPKVRLGLAVSIHGTHWSAPFSAPFGGWVEPRQSPTLRQVEAAVDGLVERLIEDKVERFDLVQAPFIYAPTLSAKVLHASLKRGFQLSKNELNFHVALAHRSDQDLLESMNRNARRNLKGAFDQGCIFERLDGADGIRRAYDIIRTNRHDKNYPLSMSQDEMVATSALVSVDAFVVRHDGEDLASALVYQTAPGIAQVIYWGDRPGRIEGSPMAFLAYELFRYYRDAGFRYVDVGTAMLGDQANYGLCEFKESIGCELQPKPILIWTRP